MQKIIPFLWFDGKLEEAAKFYTSIFSNAKILSTSPGPGGSIMSATIELEGQQLLLFNGGPMYKLTEAFSLFVTCETQEEIDEKWEKLSAGGQTSRCGWLKDKYGISWQIIPPVLGKLLGDSDAAKSKRVLDEMLKMDKIIISDLENAAASV